MDEYHLTQSGTGNYQAGRDLILPISEDEITEPEFRVIISKFMGARIYDIESDFKIIEIEDKNTLNNLSDRAFHHIRTQSISSYENLDRLLKHPANQELRDHYDSMVFSLQTQYIQSNLCGKIERFFRKVLEGLIRDGISIKERNWGIHMVYFMYLRCDLGLR